MLQAGFEPTILVFQRSKITRALDRAAIGSKFLDLYLTFCLQVCILEVPGSNLSLNGLQ
jgi:hypothetical protein